MASEMAIGSEVSGECVDGKWVEVEGKYWGSFGYVLCFGLMD